MRSKPLMPRCAPHPSKSREIQLGIPLSTRWATNRTWARMQAGHVTVRLTPPKRGCRRPDSGAFRPHNGGNGGARFLLPDYDNLLMRTSASCECSVIERLFDVGGGTG